MKIGRLTRQQTLLYGLPVAALLLLLLRIWLFWVHINSPLNLQSPYFLDVTNGMSLTAIVRQLERSEVLEAGDDLLLYARLSGSAARIKAGEYELLTGLNGRALLELLASGRVIYHQVRIGEGWTLSEALHAIQAHPAISPRIDPQNRENLTSLFATGLYPEGWFFPDTYNFTRGTTDIEILQRAKGLMEETLTVSWQGRDSGLPYDSPYEALIMASIIEKETALLHEQPQIAGVFIRRLQRNMRLQTDPSVIYGLGAEFDGNLTRAHLRQDSEWNTYTRRGLPLTAIALPGKGAIEASMHPDQSDNLYFVARGDGSHYFSATLEEHNKAVRRFQLGETQP